MPVLISVKPSAQNRHLFSEYRYDHKRIREENKKRKSAGKPVMLSEYDESIVTALMTIKSDIDRKVYEHERILHRRCIVSTRLHSFSVALPAFGVFHP